MDDIHIDLLMLAIDLGGTPMSDKPIRRKLGCSTVQNSAIMEPGKGFKGCPLKEIIYIYIYVYIYM